MISQREEEKNVGWLILEEEGSPRGGEQAPQESIQKVLIPGSLFFLVSALSTMKGTL